MIFEAFQVFSLSYYYIKDWVNFVELTLFACAIIFSFVFTDPCLCPTTWQWQIGCVAVFLAWIDFIIFIRKLPLTGNKEVSIVQLTKLCRDFVQHTRNLLPIVAVCLELAPLKFSRMYMLQGIRSSKVLLY